MREKAANPMQFEEISKYIIPFLFLLYFFSGKKKKKQPADTRRSSQPLHSRTGEVPTHEEQRSWARTEDRLNPPVRSPQMEARSIPPVQRKLSRLESAITTRDFSDRIEKRHYVSSISDERAQALVSANLSECIDMDQSYALKSREHTSRGRAVLNQLSSPKDAFILQVIINRYEY